MKAFMFLLMLFPCFLGAQVSQVQIDSKFLEVNKSWMDEIGITFGGGLSVGRIGNQDQFGTAANWSVGVEIEPWNNLFINPTLQYFPFPSVYNSFEYKINTIALSAPAILTRNDRQANIAIGIAPIITFPLNEVTKFNGEKQKHKLGDNVNRVKVGGQILPQLRIRTTSTDITLQAGATIMLGGLFKSQTGQSTNSVPVLGHISLIAKLFTNREHQQSRRNLLIFIAPQIVSPEDAE